MLADRTNVARFTLAQDGGMLVWTKDGKIHHLSDEDAQAFFGQILRGDIYLPETEETEETAEALADDSEGTAYDAACDAEARLFL